MFAIVERPDGKWVLTWGGAEFPQTPLDTREQAENRLVRMQGRYPGRSFDTALSVSNNSMRGGPYRYEFVGEVADYLEGTNIKPSGTTGARTRTDAKDAFRYRMERAGLNRDQIRALLCVLELEPV